jgi:hypothetical protein
MCCASLLETVTEESAVAVLLAQITQNQIGLEGTQPCEKFVAKFISLDGVIQAPGGPEEDTSGGFSCGGWTSPHSDPVSSTATKKADEHAV